MPMTSGYDTNTIWHESEPGKQDFKPMTVEYGDIVEWDNEFYEVDGVGASQYFAGRNPNTDLGFVTGDREEFGFSVSILGFWDDF